MVPRKDRPSPDELLEYTTQYIDGEPDYDEADVRPQLGAWLYDYRRKQEEERDQKAESDGREPFDDVLIDGARTGFDPDSFAV